MKTTDNVVAWLLQHICKCENGSITLSAIQEKYPDKSVSGHAIGRTIKKIFKGTLIKSVRTKNKSGLTKMYYGLKWKSLTYSNCSLLDIKTISGSDFFVMFESETKLQLGYFNGFAVNGHKILTEVSFHEDKHVDILVCNKEINLTDIQLSSTFLFDSKFISGILDGIRNLNLCKGVANSDMSNTEDTLIEQWSDKNGETSTKIRSTKCKRILTYTTTKSVCDECAPLLSKKFENTSKLHGEKLETHIQLSDTSHKDMTDVLDHVLKTVPDKIATFLKSQVQTIESHPNGRRWPRDIIRMCLSLYCRSPKTYHDLSRSGFVVLPSQRVLQRYKNCVQQQPGINPEMLEWMKSIAVEQNVSKDGYKGGLMIDEMAIQEDLQLKRTGENYELIGFTDTVEEAKSINTIITHKENIQLSTHVLQLVFLGNTGFRFPLAHFPCLQTSASELYLIFWKAVKMLGLFGFTVTFVSLDGAQTNRDFMKMLLRENVSKTMTFDNIFDVTKTQICLIMDYSHVVKKIRNNITKSGTLTTHKRYLKLGKKNIVWEHWYKAYQWDFYSNTLKVYQQLTQDHFFLNSQLKMRNKLAEDVLNENMLHLMTCYQRSLGDKGEELQGSIELLQHTSVIIKNFRDARPITSYSDKRLDENRKVLEWFCTWEKQNKSLTNINKKELEKSLFSYQTMEDIRSLLIGFDEMCCIHFRSTSSSIIPNRVNSDVVENVFSQQRGLHNGANTNPSYLTYSQSINAVILGSTPISKKANAEDTEAHIYRPTSSSSSCSSSSSSSTRC